MSWAKLTRSDSVSSICDLQCAVRLDPNHHPVSKRNDEVDH
jgi:hypothetical protein